MEEKSSRARASEKYRLNHKEYFNEYYRNYRKEKGQKSYYKIYKKRIDKIYDFIAEHYLFYKTKDGEFVTCDEEIAAILRGDFDEE